jgi:hypothetical protein
MSAVISACALAIILFAVPAAGQSTVSQSDIQRLQDEVYQAGSDISRMRAGNSSNLQTELDDLRDEVIYLKVKLRKEGSVNRTEYADLRDRLQNLRSRARGESTGMSQGSGTRPGTSTVGGGVSGGTSSSGTSSSGTIYDDRDRRQEPTQQSGSSSIPTGQEIDVRLQTPLSSDTAQVEQRFEATTVADLFRGSDVLIPAGSLVRGVVSSVNPATRTDRRGSLTLSFDQVTVNGRNYPMRGTVTQALESEGIKGEAGRIGAGSAVGAIIGGIMGGVKGALLGVLIGGGGTIAATEGTDVKLPAGTLLRVRLDQPPAIR